jgi:hypothetical protein
MPIKIIAKHEPHFRAGMRHALQGAVHADGAFSEEQIAALQSDPHLIVSEVADELAPAGTPPEGVENAPPAATKRKAK